MRLRSIGPDDHDYAERDATPEAVRDAFEAPELWYSSEIELLPSDPTTPYLNALAVTGPFAGPDAAGEFLLGFEDGGSWYSEAKERRFTRQEAAGYFLRYLAGDSTWLADFAWAEIAGGRRTGRLWGGITPRRDRS